MKKGPAANRSRPLGVCMYYYDFQLAGLRLRVESPFPIGKFFELSAYLVAFDPEKQPDARYRMDYLPDDWQIQGRELYRDRQNALYQQDGQLHRYYFWNPHDRNAYLLLVGREGTQTLYLPRADLPVLLPELRLSAFFSPEQLLLEHRAFQLHAAVIEWQGQGILFSAPSGTGKSTQAALWEAYAGATVINGDRAVIRYIDGQYRVYGSPYAGSSGIYTNLSAPVRAVVTLEQGKENSLRRLGAVEAFGRLYREVTVPFWDAAFVDKVSAELLGLIEQTPVYHLVCRPDSGAVDVLREKISKL